MKVCIVVIMITQIETKAILDHLVPLLPKEWFSGPPALSVDDDEILIVGTLSEQSPGGKKADAFREFTRKERMHLAKKVEAALNRSVAWGVSVDGVTTVFTSLGVPVMTRLRISERDVLDTLVAAGVAKSRSDAVAWCVRFVGQREGDWLTNLRSSLESVSKVRDEGPSLS